jgi:choline dehydrogenase
MSFLIVQQDHVYVPISFYVPARDSAHRVVANPFLAVFELIRFFLFGTGFFLSVISEYFCYFHTQRLPPHHDKTSHQVPDLELFWTAAYGSYKFPKFPTGKGAGSVMIQTSLPKSLGTVRLSPDGADDIKVDPIVDPKYLSAPEDWEVYRRGIVFAQEVGREMRKGGYPVEEVQVPASHSNEDLDEHIREFAIASQHLVSSCRMKPREEGGVVDQRLKVYGIEGLRIADGSVFPGMVASRPQATVVMIAERCADFIRQGWKEKGLFPEHQ